MKKYLPIFFSVIMLLASCAKEPTTLPGLVSATFTVSADEAPVKGVGDATLADQLTVLAYDKAGNYLDYINFTCTQTGQGTFTATARLVRGQEYTLLFFAQKSGSYTLGNDGTVTFPAVCATSDASRDAFYAVKEVTAGETTESSVALKRPFALLRFVSSQADQNVAREEHRLNGIRSQVALDKMPQKMNLLTGAVEGSVQFGFSEADASTSQEIAFVFIPAGETKTYIKATVTVTAGSFTSVRKIANIPVQRNRQTKIEGDFLTTEGTLDITLENN